MSVVRVNVILLNVVKPHLKCLIESEKSKNLFFFRKKRIFFCFFSSKTLFSHIVPVLNWGLNHKTFYARNGKEATVNRSLDGRTYPG
jgi:hypothetical protein